MKQHTFRSTKWLGAVRSLGVCVMCGAEGAVQAAHRNEDKGTAIKTHDCWTAAMCAPCHRDLDQGPGLTNDERRDLMNNAILDTLAMLAQRGLIGPK